MQQSTITIGIPLYNEEKNIIPLLHSILRQKIHNGKLVKIILISDASTDRTVQYITNFKDTRIELLINKKRLGANGSKNKILRKTTSEVLVFLNGDVILSSQNTINRLISPLLTSKRIDCTSGSVESVKPTTFFEQIIRDSHDLKMHMGEMIHKGDNIYMCYGGIHAMSKNLYNHFTFPIDVPEDAYLYLYCKKNGYKFSYVKNAKVYFRVPSTFSDHKKQSIRFISGIQNLKKYFDEPFLKNAYKIPHRIFLSSNFHYFIKNPLTNTMYILLTIYLRLISKTYRFTSTWEPSITSKEIAI